MLYLCTSKTRHASRRKTTGPGWDVSFYMEYTKQPITLAEQINKHKKCPLIVQIIGHLCYMGKTTSYLVFLRHHHIRFLYRINYLLLLFQFIFNFLKTPIHLYQFRRYFSNFLI